MPERWFDSFALVERSFVQEILRMVGQLEHRMTDEQICLAFAGVELRS